MNYRGKCILGHLKWWSLTQVVLNPKVHSPLFAATVSAAAPFSITRETGSTSHWVKDRFDDVLTVHCPLSPFFCMSTKNTGSISITTIKSIKPNPKALPQYVKYVLNVFNSTPIFSALVPIIVQCHICKCFFPAKFYIVNSTVTTSNGHWFSEATLNTTWETIFADPPKCTSQCNSTRRTTCLMRPQTFSPFIRLLG